MKKKFNYLLAFIVPLILMILLYMAVGVIGGNKNILTVDLQDQYIEFFNALKNIFDGKIGPFYSFSKTLGGNMFGLITYYLLSPFNLIIMFFNRLTMPQAILIINILKIATTGLTSYIYFNKTFKNNEKTSLMFSLIYALMAYNIVYSQNIMWLDGVILLPLIFLGIDKLIEKKPTLFYITLTLAIIFNYYIGYMLCIGSLIYFTYKNYLKEKKIDIKKTIYFIKILLLSVLTSSVILLPSAVKLTPDATIPFPLAVILLFSMMTKPLITLIATFSTPKPSQTYWLPSPEPFTVILFPTTANASNLEAIPVVWLPVTVIFEIFSNP